MLLTQIRSSLSLHYRVSAFPSLGTDGQHWLVSVNELGVGRTIRVVNHDHRRSPSRDVGLRHLLGDGFSTRARSKERDVGAIALQDPQGYLALAMWTSPA